MALRRRKERGGYRIITTGDPAVFLVKGDIEAFNEDQEVWREHFDRMAKESSERIDRLYNELKDFT